MKAMNSVRKNKKKGGFKSYIDSLEDYHERPVDVPEEVKVERIDPILLPDEVVVAEAKNVLKFTSLRTKKVVILGTLFVTNFKISFVTSSLPVDVKENDLHSGCLHSDFLGLLDVSLTQIDSIYCLLEADGLKKKKLACFTLLPNKIKGLQIVLKSFRIINFDFALTQPKEDIKVTNALLVHRYPKKLDLFYLALDTPPPDCGVPNFRLLQDWDKELKRTRCPNWRICKYNEDHKTFPSLPSTFVVPQCITDGELSNAAHHFRGNRPPVWCWGTPSGSALVRMAQLSPNISSSKSIENHLIMVIHKSHSQKVQPTIKDLDQELPSLKSIQTAFLKLRDLHTPDSLASFNENEKYYLSRWQSSGWLTHVRMCLEVAQNASSALAIRNSSVILQEFEGRDLSCIISSLVQILLDPFARTFRGFHTLVQKEWVALGHPFCVRLGHTKPSSEEVCPLWLLFLDCVHQISVHHRSAFEFTPDYLLALWQASHCSLHSTFMFDSIRENLNTLAMLREESRSKEAYFWPVWAWWSRSEGLRTALQKGCLDAQKESLHRRQLDYEKRLSLVGTNEPNNTLKKDASLGQLKREILTEEKHLRNEEESFRREGEVRARARESFINVLYVQTLLEPLLAPDCLSRLADPLASVHATWHRLYHLLGRGDSPLPYDPSLSLPQMEISQGLQIQSYNRVRPWTECFGLWVNEPSTHPPGGGENLRSFIEPCRSSLDEHWRLVREIFSILEKMYSSVARDVRNGVGS